MYQFLNGFEDELGLEPQVNGGDATRNGLLDIVTKIAGGAKQNKRAPVQTANEGFGGFGGGGYDDPGFDYLGAWNAGPAAPPQTGARGPSIASLFANGGADLVAPDPFGGVEEAMGRAALRQRRLDADAQKAAAADTRRQRGRPTLSAQIANQADAAAWHQAWRDGDDISDDDMQAALTERRAQDRADGNYAALPTEDLKQEASRLEERVNQYNTEIDKTLGEYEERLKDVDAAEKLRKWHEENPDAYQKYLWELVPFAALNFAAVRLGKAGVGTRGVADYMANHGNDEQRPRYRTWTKAIDKVLPTALTLGKRALIVANIAELALVSVLSANDAYAQANKDEIVKRARGKADKILKHVAGFTAELEKDQAKLAMLRQTLGSREK